MSIESIEAKRLRNAEYMRRFRERQRAAGLCQHCNELPVPGTVHCPKHTELNRAGARAHRQKHIDAGLCVTCHEPPREGRLRCARCQERRTQRDRGRTRAKRGAARV
jgi:hypothetical protein